MRLEEVCACAWKRSKEGLSVFAQNVHVRFATTVTRMERTSGVLCLHAFIVREGRVKEELRRSKVQYP